MFSYLRYCVYTEGIYREWGHTGLVWDNSGGTNTFTILEQNYDGNANTRKLREDDYTGLTHFIVPDFANSVDLTDIKEVKATKRQSNSSITVNKKPKN